MKQFKLWNNVFGWVAFAIAAVTYLLTIEPTASFWDCGEFISAAYKLDVGHPPGAPFFMLTARFFSLFASDPTQVAAMVNSMSALLSAFTILFLFWTITHLARKIVIKSETDYTPARMIAILGAGLVGALAYTFSDTFWFSAVEGEVYAYSSFFTAIVFWLILKWEDASGCPGSDRWLILIAYLMGISIGVHLLNLLAIPALVLVYYFRNYKPTAKGIVLAMAASGAILASVLYGAIPGFVEVASWFELLFVNTFGFKFNSGLFVYFVLLVAVLGWAIYESYVNKSLLRVAISLVAAVTLSGIPFFGGHIWLGVLVVAALVLFFYYKKNKINVRWINTALVMVAVLLIGYSSYTVIVIRSAAKPTMDQNAPNNVFALKYYLNREQYGDRPLFYGPVYNAPLKTEVSGDRYQAVEKRGDALYSPKPKKSPAEKDEYVLTGYKTDYVMNEKFNMFFPRMYSSPNVTPRHIEAYKAWGRVAGKKVDYDFCGEMRSEQKPTFGENIRFFFDYQLNFMYWRYFMWNFSGRQNDIQGNGEIEHGNWITGINFIDNLLVGNQKNLPSAMKENKGRNTYFLLPLLLGIIGILYLLGGGKKGVEGFWVILLLFVLTGIAIVVYLNQIPYQPRERDYAYAGSFYAFCIWIGFGVLGILRVIDKYLPKTVAALAVTLCCLGVPALMAQQNWDDHDRSGRYTCRDFGQNYLASCKENAIIFTNGDNDTFPLWYNQEVEGYRTDVRVCNLSYLQTDWYVDQMKRGAYKSAPLPISWDPEEYLAGRNEVMQVEDVYKKPVDVRMAFDVALKRGEFKNIEGESFLPSFQLFIPVDARSVVANGALPAARAAEVIPQIDVSLKSQITRSDLMILEILKENNWKRPVYFSSVVGTSLNLKDHLEQTGLAYQMLPVGEKGSGSKINTEEMYNNLMTKFKYGGIANPKVYLDETILNMCRGHRQLFVQLIGALLEKGDTVRARKALHYCEKVIPGTSVRHDYLSCYLASYYYELGEPVPGNRIINVVAKDCVENLDWYLGLNPTQRNNSASAISENMQLLGQVLQVCNQAKQKSIVDKYWPRFREFNNRIRM